MSLLNLIDVKQSLTDHLVKTDDIEWSEDGMRVWGPFSLPPFSPTDEHVMEVWETGNVYVIRSDVDVLWLIDVLNLIEAEKEPKVERKVAA